MPKNSTMLADDWVKMFVFGGTGSGKTNFLGTVCDKYKTYIISAERGLKTIANKKFDYDDITVWAEYIKQLNWYAANYKKEGYEALCIDSFTRAAYLLSLQLEGDGKLERDDYRIIIKTLNAQLMLLTTKLDCHVFVTGIAGDDKDESTGAIKRVPRIMGQTRDMLPEYFDVVALAKCGVDKDGKTKYWHQIEGDDSLDAKSRMGHLRGKKNVAPTIETYIKGDK